MEAIPLTRNITKANNELQTVEVADAEIFEAMKQINPLKASGTYGIQAIFYHKYWDIIGTSVCNMVRSFSNHKHMFKELNRT